MPGRTFLFVGILIVAVAGPYLLSRRGGPSGPAEGKAPSPTLWDRVSQWGSDAATPSPDAGNAANLALHATQSDGLPGRPVPTQQLGGPAGISLPNAIRLDVTPEWIAQNWARVSTQLADPDYYGVRVPLVTGTELHDVAGSLSLYFNEERRLERLMFYGYTGDTQPLVALIEQRFGMRRYATTANAGLYLGFYGPDPVAVMWVDDNQLQEANQPQSRYRVQLELNLPRPGATLSRETLTKLRKLQDAKLL